MRNIIMSVAALAVLIAAPAQANPGPMDANLFVALSKKLVPSVVNISTFTTVKGNMFGGNGSDDPIRRFFEDMFRHGRRGDGGAMPPEGFDGEEAPKGRGPRGEKPPKGALPKSMSLGSGFIIDASGLILTNNHVVADADEIKISFTEDPTEKPTEGEVVGRDPELDVALIRVKTKRELIPMVLGDSDATEVGEYVAAIGNPFGQGHSVTHGIISAKGRVAPDFVFATYLQTDAPINPGNSGGPLVNLKGEVIGINNAIEQRAQGIGFAIPVNLVKKVLPQLKTKGSVSRGYIGVLVQEITPEVGKKLGLPADMTAPFVSQVVPGEPADKAGLKTYDVIMEFNGKPVRTHNELIMAVTAVPVGETVPIKVLRDGKELTLSIKVAKRPSPDQAVKQEKQPRKKGKNPSRLDIGMDLEDLTPETAQELGLTKKTAGVVVAELSFGGPAHKAGLMRGDLIVEVDQKPIKNVDGFFATVKEKKSYLLRVRRMNPSGQEGFVVVILDLKGE